MESNSGPGRFERTGNVHDTYHFLLPSFLPLSAGATTAAAAWMIPSFARE